MGRRSAIAIAAAALVLAACAPGPGRALRGVDRTAVEQPSGRPPVLIVPGWALACRHGPADEWQRWVDAFEAAGWAEREVAVVDYDTCAPATATSIAVGEAFDVLLARAGASQGIVVAHSMGAIPARRCVASGSCAGRVTDVVTLSGANHGTIWSALCGAQYWSPACLDMRPDGATLFELNQGDETPGDARWQAWVSVCEIAILPRSSALLAGAENHDLVDRCIFHDDWKRDDWAIDTIVGSLATNRP